MKPYPAVQQGLPLPTPELSASVGPTQHWTAVCFILSELLRSQSTTSLRSWKASQALRGHCLPCLVSMLAGRCRVRVASPCFQHLAPSSAPFRLSAPAHGSKTISVIHHDTGWVGMEEYQPTYKTKSRISRFQFQNCKKRCFLDVNNVILTFYKINLKWLKKRHEAGIMAHLKCSVIFFLGLVWDMTRSGSLWAQLEASGTFSPPERTWGGRVSLDRWKFPG